MCHQDNGWNSQAQLSGKLEPERTEVREPLERQTTPHGRRREPLGPRSDERVPPVSFKVQMSAGSLLYKLRLAQG